MNTQARIFLGLLLVAIVAQHGKAADQGLQQIRFDQQPTQVNDQVVQTVDVQIEIDTTITQAGQIAHQSAALQHRQVERMIEVKQVVDGQIRKAQVAFRTFRKRSHESKSPKSLSQNHAGGYQRPEKSEQLTDSETFSKQFVAEPVEGKSYRVTRDGKKLIVTDLNGAIPPQDEYQRVVDNLQTLGLPNPLTEFLLGKTVTLGECLQLPKKIAEKLLDFGHTEGEDLLGAIETFELRLTEIKQIDGRQCAIFTAKIVVRGTDAGPIQMEVAGKFVFEVATTRALSTELHGPITLSVEQNTGQNSFHYAANGDVKIAIHSKYNRARQ